LEPVPHQTGDVVQLGVVEIDQALRVAEDLHLARARLGRRTVAQKLENPVGRARRGVAPLEDVAEAVAATAADAAAQAEHRRLPPGGALRLQLLDLRDRGLRAVERHGQPAFFSWAPTRAARFAL